MTRRFIILLTALFLIFAFSSAALVKTVSAAQERQIFGSLVKRGNVLVLETDDGDYLVKGRDLAKMEGKMVKIVGTISESDQGDTIDVKSVEELDE